MSYHKTDFYKKRANLYSIGYVLSVFLTCVAFWLVVAELINGWQAVALVMTLAVAQLVVQLLFFLHLDEEPKPRLNLMSFGFMVMVVFMIVAGSLWIMANLNYNMQHKNTLQYVQEEENIHPEHHDDTVEHTDGMQH